ncbi:Short-chain dehydrogenase/reductase SDR [Hyphomicrobium sp. GJ21]|uniref:SDR family NAD(P)-dependent oxidoreductase n=1 Tax=Hyphomicrobium sp. GJ21 TaxID=113574 RepID=UPI000622C1A4|nr:SDR family NAD(P)-dependent oxidoreductase [Hyphomicrobium sp. GJ21]CEJ88568.1 Short-chain dehydrogenase/reductase SDR [Hyphomicrobium sp. GJ21]
MPGPQMNKTALVTGANRGIGFAIARQLAELGITVLAGVRNGASAASATAAFGKIAVDVQPVILDVANVAALPSALKDIEQRHAPIDILVNNAAILIDGPGGFDASLFDMTDETFRLTWETNVLAPAAIIRTLLPGMIAREYGRVVNVSSLAGQLAGMGSGFPAYRISKTALNALTRIAAAEAGRGDVKVNACSPGWVRTGMGGPEASRLPDKGAETPVWLATLPSDGPTGGFFEDKKAVPW